MYQTEGAGGGLIAGLAPGRAPGTFIFWPVFKFVPHFTHMMARGETSLPQLGQVGAPVATAASGAAAIGGGAAEPIRNAGAGAIAGAGARAPTGVGTVILTWQVGQGISSPA